MAANGSENPVQQAATATATATTTPSNDELKEAIKQYKAENPESTFKLALNFVRTDKAWFVSEARLRKVMSELGFLQNRDDESYLEGRMASLLDSGSGDVSFMVGPLREVVKAHKVIVHHNCPSLLESYPLKADNTVDIPEISPESFKTFIRFLYIARVKLATLHVAKEVMLLSKKVVDERLCGICVDMIASQLDVNNVCDIFSLCSSLLPDTSGHIARLRQLCGGFFHSHQKEVMPPCTVSATINTHSLSPSPHSQSQTSLRFLGRIGGAAALAHARSPPHDPSPDTVWCRCW